MAEENQVQQEPQQITKEPQQITKEPQRVTTKDPKKVKAGKRLDAINRKKREEQAQLDRMGVKQYYSMGSLSDSGPAGPIGTILALGAIGGLGYLHLSNQERRAGRRATFKPAMK